MEGVRCFETIGKMDETSTLWYKKLERTAEPGKMTLTQNTDILLVENCSKC
jgi:hypothetical protein